MLFYLPMSCNNEEPEPQIKKLNFPDPNQKLFSDISLMIDLSRGGVYKVEFLKKVIKWSKALGINSIGFYTEFFEMDYDKETFKKYGQLSKVEIKKLVKFADKFGIEIYPCIQTLAHLEKFLSNPKYQQFRLNNSKSTIDPNTKYIYENFIEPMIKNAIEPYIKGGKKLRINIGCDEAFDLTDYDLYVSHIKRVSKICQKYNLKSYIWGDIIAKFSTDQVKQLPKNLKIVYWNYDETDEIKIESDLQNYKLKGINLTATATSTCSHNQLIPFWQRAKLNIDAMFKSTRNQQITEFMITLWHDDNSEAPFQAALPSLAYFSAISHGRNAESANKLLEQICGNNFTFFETASFMNVFDKDCLNPVISPLTPNALKMLTFENPKYIPFSSLNQKSYNCFFQTIYLTLKSYSTNILPKNKNLFNYFAALADFLSIKADLGKSIKIAYIQAKSSDTAILDLLNSNISVAIDKLNMMRNYHRIIWLEEKNKEGLEEIDRRYENSIDELISLQMDIQQFLSNNCSIPYIEKIPEKIISQFPFGVRYYEDIFNSEFSKNQIL